jgi:hypothetical protein
MNTGIACVSPAWKIMEVLNRGELVKQRREEDEKIKVRREREKTTVLDSSNDSQEVFTKEHFEAALTKVSRKKTDET